MTAYRVIDAHSELTGVGVTVHSEIDTHVSASSFLVLSSSANVPPDARQLVAGQGITFDDHGPGNTLELNVSGTITVSASLPPPSSIGQVLFSVDGLNFTAQSPLVSPDGWLLNSSGTLLVIG